MTEVNDKIKGNAVTNETPSEHSLGLAAQAWCEPETSHKIMDEALCTAFARILDRVQAQLDAGPVAWRGVLEPFAKIDGDTRTDEQKQPGPKYVPIGGAGNGA